MHTGYVISIKWVDRDRVLISYCNDGKLLCTNMNPYQNLLAHTCPKEIQYTAIEYDYEFDLILAFTEFFKAFFSLLILYLRSKVAYVHK